MASLLFPDTGTRMVLLPSGAQASGRIGTLYAAATGTTLAEVYAHNGTATPGALIATAQITLDQYGQQPYYWGPAAGTDTLYLEVNGVRSRVNADYDARLDALEPRVTAVETGKVALTPTGLQQLQTQRAGPLRVWHYALANRLYAPAVVATIGASTTEGVGPTAYSRMYLVRLRELLRARFPVSGIAGGDNYVAAWGGPAEGATPAYTWPVAHSAGVGNSNTTGWALKGSTLTGAAQTLTYTFTGTSVQVWYSQYGGGGRFSVTIDSVVVAASVDTNGATDRAARWLSGALAAGSHTIVLTWVAGGASPAYIHGFAAYNGDEAAGVQVYNGAQGSRTSTDFVTNAVQWSPRLATIQPHLVLLQLGLNDYQQNIPSATMKANLLSIISTVRANCTSNPSFVLYGSPRLTSGTFAEPYANYVTAWQQIAAEDTAGYGGASGVAYFDLELRQPAPPVDNTFGLYNSDLTHPTDKGSSQIADALAAFLAPN